MAKPASKLHRHLRLQHHRHTGRMLQHKHTSYRGLAVVIVLASAFMLGLNMMARAAAYTIDGGGAFTVYASLPAPTPTDAAVITSPADNAVVTKSRLPVSGTCPVMAFSLVVGIIDNGVLAGSVPCQSDGTFAITIVVDLGRHVLVAKTYTVTGDSGPDSDPVHVFHISEAGQAVNTDTRGGPQGEGASLVVTIDEPFIVFGPAKDAIWLGTITGGTLPYQVHIGWGDGTASDYKVTKGGAQQFAHHYRSMEPHTISFRVTDASGRSVLKTYAAVTPYKPPAIAGTTITPWGGSVPLGLYGAYLLLLVVFGGLWAQTHRQNRQFAYAKIPVRRGTAAKRKRKPAGH